MAVSPWEPESCSVVFWTKNALHSLRYLNAYPQSVVPPSGGLGSVAWLEEIRHLGQVFRVKASHHGSLFFLLAMKICALSFLLLPEGLPCTVMPPHHNGYPSEVSMDSSLNLKPFTLPFMSCLAWQHKSNTVGTWLEHLCLPVLYISWKIWVIQHP